LSRNCKFSFTMRSFLYLSALVGAISALPFQTNIGMPFQAQVDVDLGLTKAGGGGDMTILCTSDTDDTTGFCASEQACANGRGRSIGTCGMGVCCKIEASCASTTTFPVTYFTSPSYPDTDSMDVACNLNVEVKRKVCQLRVDFLDFELPGPARDGRCQNTNSFKIFSRANPRGILGGDEQNGLCGLNEGQHLYVPVEPSDVVQMHFTLSGTGTIPNSLVQSLNSQTSYKWNLKITQVECGSDNEAMTWLEAPSGCLQYFQDSFGTLTSFNLDGISPFSPSQDYWICVGQENDDPRNACGVELRAQTFGIPVDNTPGAEDGAIIPDPSNPYQTVPECQLGDRLVNTRTKAQCCVAPNSASLGVVASDDNKPGSLRYHYCGERLGDSNQIVTNPRPYVLNVRSPKWPKDWEVPKYAVGFQIQYKINTGSC